MGYEKMMQGKVVHQDTKDVLYHFRIFLLHEKNTVEIGVIIDNNPKPPDFHSNKWSPEKSDSKKFLIRNLLKKNKKIIKHDLDLRTRKWKILRQALEIELMALEI